MSLPRRDIQCDCDPVEPLLVLRDAAVVAVVSGGDVADEQAGLVVQSGRERKSSMKF